ncbi:hypothetical protein EON65_43940 [archaeon]|nr:MAG: hypothetical protein EON65_43940 [archaeon]
MFYRHHGAYFVFGNPGSDTKAQNYQKRLTTHQKYKKQYESLVWMIEGLDEKSMKMFNWGR